jgi:hypothetical protein
MGVAINLITNENGSVLYKVQHELKTEVKPFPKVVNPELYARSFLKKINLQKNGIKKFYYYYGFFKKDFLLFLPVSFFTFIVILYLKPK